MKGQWEAANCMRLFEAVGVGMTLINVHPIVVLPNLKAIAHIAQGLDVRRSTGIRLDLAPERIDAAIDTPGSDADVAAPNMAKNVITDEGAPGVLCEELQEAVFFRRERNFGVVAKQLV